MKAISNSKSKPLVSVVITTRNRVDLLKRAVKSVQDQTYPNLELIIVDDGSTDETETWCESQDFNYIRIKPNEGKGGNFARNNGIYASNGKYVAFLDDDDYWLNTKIEKQVEVIEKTGNELVHCWRKLEIINGNIVRLVNCPLSLNHKGNLRKRILFQITTLTSAILVRKSALLEIGGFDENCKFWQEYDLTIRLAQRRPFDMVEDYLLVYRIDETDTNRLTNKYDGWLKNVDYIYSKYSNLYSRLNYIDKFRVKILFWKDSSSRAKTAHMNEIWLKHSRLHLIFNIPFRIFDKIIHYIKKYG